MILFVLYDFVALNLEILQFETDIIFATILPLLCQYCQILRIEYYV